MYVAAATALGITPQEFLLQQVTISLLFLSLQFKTFFVNILGEVKAKHSVTEKFDSIMPGNNKIIDMCQHLPEMLPRSNIHRESTNVRFIIYTENGVLNCF